MTNWQSQAQNLGSNYNSFNNKGQQTNSFTGTSNNLGNQSNPFLTSVGSSQTQNVFLNNNQPKNNSFTTTPQTIRPTMYTGGMYNPSSYRNPPNLDVEMEGNQIKQNFNYQRSSLDSLHPFTKVPDLASASMYTVPSVLEEDKGTKKSHSMNHLPEYYVFSSEELRYLNFLKFKQNTKSFDTRSQYCVLTKRDKLSLHQKLTNDEYVKFNFQGNNKMHEFHDWANKYRNTEDDNTFECMKNLVQNYQPNNAFSKVNFSSTNNNNFNSFQNGGTNNFLNNVQKNNTPGGNTDFLTKLNVLPKNDNRDITPGKNFNTTFPTNNTTTFNSFTNTNLNNNTNGFSNSTINKQGVNPFTQINSGSTNFPAPNITHNTQNNAFQNSNHFNSGAHLNNFSNTFQNSQNPNHNNSNSFITPSFNSNQNNTSFPFNNNSQIQQNFVPFNNSNQIFFSNQSGQNFATSPLTLSNPSWVVAAPSVWQPHQAISISQNQDTQQQMQMVEKMGKTFYEANQDFEQKMKKIWEDNLISQVVEPHRRDQQFTGFKGKVRTHDIGANILPKANKNNEKKLNKHESQYFQTRNQNIILDTEAGINSQNYHLYNYMNSISQKSPHDQSTIINTSQMIKVYNENDKILNKSYLQNPSILNPNFLKQSKLDGNNIGNIPSSFNLKKNNLNNTTNCLNNQENISLKQKNDINTEVLNTTKEEKYKLLFNFKNFKEKIFSLIVDTKISNYKIYDKVVKHLNKIFNRRVEFENDSFYITLNDRDVPVSGEINFEESSKVEGSRVVSQEQHQSQERSYPLIKFKVLLNENKLSEVEQVLPLLKEEGFDISLVRPKLSSEKRSQKSSQKLADYAPVLSKKYLMKPCFEDLCQMDKSQLQYVRNFILWNDYGRIDFKVPVDLTYVNLDCIELGDWKFDLNANDQTSYCKLNKPMQIILKNSLFPEINNEADLEAYMEAVAGYCRWSFKVKKFNISAQ